MHQQDRREDQRNPAATRDTSSELVEAYRPGVEDPVLVSPERLQEEDDLIPWDERDA